MGRLLITLLLCEREVLRLPLLYLSHYLEFHRTEYCDRLRAIHRLFEKRVPGAGSRRGP